MADDDLTGNMPTEKFISYFKEDLGINMQELENSLQMSSSVFIQ